MISTDIFKQTFSHPAFTVGSWCVFHPTSAKVMGVVTGIGLLIALPYAAPLATTAALTGMTVVGVSLISISALSIAIPLWGSSSKWISTAAKIFTLFFGAALAGSVSFTGITHLFGVSISLVGMALAGLSTAAIALPTLGKGIGALAEIAPYAAGSALIGYAILPLIKS